MNIKELSNLKILNITFENDNLIEKEKEIYLKDIFPNLKKLKIITKRKDNYNLIRVYERSKGPIFNIPLNLFSQIEDLTLIRTCIYIKNLTDGLTFPSLKNLKIKYTDFNFPLRIHRIHLNFPNLKYFYSEENGDVSIKKFSLNYYLFFWNVDLNEIHLKYPCLTFFKYIYNDNDGYDGYEDFTEITMRKFGNNFIKYERKYAYNGHGDEYYSKSYSYFNNENNLGKEDNFVEIYNFIGLVSNKILFEKSNNYSVQYIDIIIGKGYDMEENIIIDFIENIKYFKFLKSFCLIFEAEYSIDSKNLLILVDNLSTLKLLENIVILVLDGGFKARRGFIEGIRERGHAYIRRGRGMNRGRLSRENIGGNRGSNINISKEDENIILNKIKNIKIEKTNDYFLIELESKIFYEERFKRLKIIPGILSETNINNYK